MNRGLHSISTMVASMFIDFEASGLRTAACKSMIATEEAVCWFGLLSGTVDEILYVLSMA